MIESHFLLPNASVYVCLFVCFNTLFCASNILKDFFFTNSLIYYAAVGLVITFRNANKCLLELRVDLLLTCPCVVISTDRPKSLNALLSSLSDSVNRSS